MLPEAAFIGRRRHPGPLALAAADILLGASPRLAGFSKAGDHRIV